MQNKLNDAVFQCVYCGRPCTNQEIELSPNKFISCFDCEAKIALWQESVGKLR